MQWEIWGRRKLYFFSRWDFTVTVRTKKHYSPRKCATREREEGGERETVEQKANLYCDVYHEFHSVSLIVPRHTLSEHVRVLRLYPDCFNQCHPVSRGVRQCHAVASSVKQCQAVSSSIRHYQAVLPTVNQRQTVAINVYPISISVNQCPAATTKFNQCQPSINQWKPVPTSINQHRPVFVWFIV